MYGSKSISVIFHKMEEPYSTPPPPPAKKTKSLLTHNTTVCMGILFYNVEKSPLYNIHRFAISMTPLCSLQEFPTIEMPMFRQEIEYGTMAKIYSLLPGGCPEPYCYDKANAMSKSINTCNNYIIDHDYNHRPWTTDYGIGL